MLLISIMVIVLICLIANLVRRIIINRRMLKLKWTIIYLFYFVEQNIEGVMCKSLTPSEMSIHFGEGNQYEKYIIRYPLLDISFTTVKELRLQISKVCNKLYNMCEEEELASYKELILYISKQVRHIMWEYNESW